MGKLWVSRRYPSPIPFHEHLWGTKNCTLEHIIQGKGQTLHLFPLFINEVYLCLLAEEIKKFGWIRVLIIYICCLTWFNYNSIQLHWVSCNISKLNYSVILWGADSSKVEFQMYVISFYSSKFKCTQNWNVIVFKKKLECLEF